MRLSSPTQAFACLSLTVATITSAFVVPDVPEVRHALNQAPLRGSPKSDYQPGSDSGHDSWWNSIPSKEAVGSAFHEAVDSATETLDNTVDALHDIETQFKDQIKQAVTSIDSTAATDPLNALGGGHDYKHHTIYQLISLSNHTKRFIKLVNEYPDIVDLLNSTEADHEHTLFVPVDEAFEDIPDDHEKPSKEFVEKVLLYHVGIGRYPAKRILGTHTLPSALKEEWLGGEQQRLRPSVGLGGVKINFYSKVIAADVGAKNGIIHAVRDILIPPPFAGREISLFPQYFSSLLLAYEKTDFVQYIHGLTTIGSTIFAPTNRAFAWLGPRANAFLFNTEQGRGYLRALLKYHIAPNATLYTDAFYDKTGEDDGDSVETNVGREHYELETLLGDKRVAVDIGTFWGFRRVRVNGFVGLSVADGVAKNGVIQVVDKVLIPPHKHGRHDEVLDEEEGVDVEDLMERLEGYLD